MKKDYSIYSAILTFIQKGLLKKLVVSSPTFKINIEKLISIQYSIVNSQDNQTDLTEFEKVAELYCSATEEELEIEDIELNENKENLIANYLHSLVVFTKNLLDVDVEYVFISDEETFKFHYDKAKNTPQMEFTKPSSTLDKPIFGSTNTKESNFDETYAETATNQINPEQVTPSQFKEALKNFNPYDTVSKYILKLKKIVGWLLLGLILLTFVFAGVLIAYYYIGQVTPTKGTAKPPELQTIIFQVLVGEVIFTVLILGIIAYTYLRKPRNEKEKYEFSLIWAILIICYALYTTIFSYRKYIDIQVSLQASDLQIHSTPVTNSLEIALKWISITNIAAFGILCIITIIGIQLRPKINPQKVQAFLEKYQRPGTIQFPSNQNTNAWWANRRKNNKPKDPEDDPNSAENTTSVDQDNKPNS